jgi:hypothetical protein
MIKSALTFLLAFSLITTFAQTNEKELKKHVAKVEKSKEKKSVEVSLDTLFNAGIPYCVYIEGKRFLGNILDITIKDLNGTDAIWCKMVTNTELNRTDFSTAYEITFAQSGNKALYLITFGNTFPKEIVKHNLFVNGLYNAANENKFISFNPYKAGIQVPQIPQNNGYPNNNAPALVDRNRSSMVQIFGNEIKQDFKVIGKIAEKSQAKDGTIINTISITLPDGTLLARAEAEQMKHNWTIVTAKDNKEHTVNSSLGNDKKDISDYLIKYLYL